MVDPAQVLGQEPQPLGHHGLEQCLLGREVPVDRARADAGPPGDLVKRYGQALVGERRLGGLQHTGAVPPGVGA